MNNQNDKIKVEGGKPFWTNSRCQTNLIVLVSILFLSSCQQPLTTNLSPCFSINAVAAMPSHETIKADAFEDAAGRVRFHGASFGQIRLFLPVTNNTGQLTDNVNWDRFKVLYLDPDGAKDDYGVSATLQYLDATGATPIVAELDSNDFADSGINTMSTAFAHDFDFTNRYYYIEIKLFRKNTAANPWVGGVSLCEQFQ